MVCDCCRKLTRQREPMKQTDMESELEDYLSNIGLSSSMLKSTSSARVDDHAQPTSAAVSRNYDIMDNDNNDSAEASRPVVSLTAVDGGQVSNGASEDHMAMSADVCPTDLAASPTDVDCRAATSTHANCASRSENLTQHAVLLRPANRDRVDHVNHTRTQQLPSSNDNGDFLSSRQRAVTSNGNVAQTDRSEVSDSVTPQPSSSRSAVVFSTVPRHVDGASTLPSSRTQRAPTSASCTIMLSGETADVVGSSPAAPAHRAAGDTSERSAAEVAGRVRKTSADAKPYTSTIIRCSSSSAPVIATSNNKSRDTDAPAAAAAVDDWATPPPAKSHVKTAPNYVSVVQVGSVSSAPSPDSTERRETPLTTVPADSVDGSSVTLGRSSLRIHVDASDAPSGTPMKSSLKKVAPGHVKSKSVSFFSVGSADGSNVDGLSMTATTVETSTVRPRHPSQNEVTAREDGTGPRRALVSDSGVFCEPEDEVTSDDSKVTATPPSRRTTVTVSGGMASLKNSPGRHQRQQLADVTADTKPETQTSNRTRGTSGSSGSLRLQVSSLPSGSSASVNVTDTKHPSTENTTPQVRQKTSDTTQVTRSFLSHFHIPKD